jgi:hypothetical protein
MYKKYLSFLLVFPLFFAFASSASATSITLGSTHGQTDQIGRIGWNYRVTQSFYVTTAQTLSSITVNLKTSGSPPDGIQAVLLSDSAGSPNTVIATTGTQSGITSSYTAYELPFSSAPELTPNTDYWITIERTGSASSSDFFQISTDTSNAYANGRMRYQYTDGTYTTGGDGGTFDLRGGIVTADVVVPTPTPTPTPVVVVSSVDPAVTAVISDSGIALKDNVKSGLQTGAPYMVVVSALFWAYNFVSGKIAGSSR